MFDNHAKLLYTILLNNYQYAKYCEVDTFNYTFISSPCEVAKSNIVIP